MDALFFYILFILCVWGGTCHYTHIKVREPLLGVGSGYYFRCVASGPNTGSQIWWQALLNLLSHLDGPVKKVFYTLPI